MARRLTHLDAAGRARVVDVSRKPITRRECVARGEVRMLPATLACITRGEIEKGDVFAIARVAGIQAAKRAHEWIPLAHPLPIEAVQVEVEPDPGGSGVRLEATVATRARTGVEMEALVAVAAAGLAIYDMCKAIDRGMTLENVRLVRKSGGKSGLWRRSGELRSGRARAR